MVSELNNTERERNIGVVEIHESRPQRNSVAAATMSKKRRFFREKEKNLPKSHFLHLESLMLCVAVDYGCCLAGNWNSGKSREEREKVRMRKHWKKGSKVRK
ncbi:DUF4357 domain-containing protein [Sesbania bispinosa]|nr:DUF4357 domain-containing protein [Sesbania bispinosa]